MRLFSIILLLVVASASTGWANGAELRGGWVTAWNPGLFNQFQADATIAAAKRAGLNALFVQVRKVGDAYYESSIEPRGDDLAPGFDPLAYMVKKGHVNGIQIHAWINVCRVWREKKMPSDCNHLVNRHPEWLNRNYDGTSHASDGMFLDPGIPEAREYTAALIGDIARRYEVDGIHLDYIRYPGEDWGYTSESLSRYRKETGASGKPKPENAKWTQWRIAQVTEMLRLIRQQVNAVRPNTVISAATVTWGDCKPIFSSTLACKRTCQNWSNWLDCGLLDANMPMNYRSEASPKAAAQFRGWLRGFTRWSGDRPTYVGLDVHQNNPSGIIRQIAAVRKAGLQGYVLFSFNQSALRDTMVAALAKQNINYYVGAVENFAGEEMLYKGMRCASANQLGMAAVYLKKAIDLDPNCAEAHFCLGCVYLRERNDSGARQCFAAALALDPQHEGAKAELSAME